MQHVLTPHEATPSLHGHRDARESRHQPPETTCALHACAHLWPAVVGRNGRASALPRAGRLPVPPEVPAAPPAPQQREQVDEFAGRARELPACRAAAGRLPTAMQTCERRAKVGVVSHSCAAGGGGRRVALEQCGHGGHDGEALHANKCRRCGELVGRKWPTLPSDFPLSKDTVSDSVGTHPRTSAPLPTRGAVREGTIP